MKIELVTGATTFEAAVNTIKQIDVKTEHNLVVVPDAFSMQAENLIFKTLGISSTFNIEVVGISRLAGKILRQSGIDFKRVSALEEIFCIYKAVKSCEEHFQYFSNGSVEVCQKILEIIKQFKACKVTPERIKPCGQENLDKKMHDLKMVYVAYNGLMEGRLDLSSLLEFFLKNAKKDIDLSKFNLFFANFDSFTLEINAFICQLAKMVNKVCIGMARPISPRNAYIYENDILRKTTALATEFGVTVETKNFPTALTGQALDIATNLFAFEVERKKNGHFLNVLAKSPQDEVEYVAKHIRFEVFRGKRFKNFAVAVADKKYYEMIKSEFEKFKIAFNCDDSVDLSQTILGRFVLKILSIAKLGFKRCDLEYLASTPLLSPSSEVLSQIQYYCIDDEKEFVKMFAQYKEIVQLIKKLHTSKTLSEASATLLEVLALVEENLSKLISSMDALHKKASENEQSFQLLRAVLEKLVQEKEEMSLADFECILKLAMQSVKVETIPSYVDAVFVGDATDSYFEDVDVLFVLGAVAGALPRTQSDTGIINDEDIHKLNFSLEPEVKVLNRRNRLKLFELLQHGKNLIVCTPKMVDGRQSEQAEFVGNLLTLFGNRTLQTSAYEDFDVALFTPQQNLERLMFYVGCEENVLPAYTLLKSKQKLPRALTSALASVLRATVPEDVDVEYLPKQEICTISASELECYFACPKKRFFRYALKLKEKESIESNKRLFGNFQHALLKEFVEQGNLKGLSAEDVENFVEKRALPIAKTIYDERVLKGGYLLKFLKNESKIILKNVVKEQNNSQFSPWLLEEKIFDHLEGGVNLVGFIDRVDRSGKYFRILDYKTGKTQNVQKDLFYGKKLQLFLYANAIQKRTKLECAGVYYFDCQTKFTSQNETKNLFKGLTLRDNDVVRLTDGRIDDGQKSDIIGVSIKKTAKGDFAYTVRGTIEGFAKEFEYAQNVSLKAVQEMNDGYAPSKPFKGGCMMCPYISICRHTDGHRETL